MTNYAVVIALLVAPASVLHAGLNRDMIIPETVCADGAIAGMARTLPFRLAIPKMTRIFVTAGVSLKWQSGSACDAASRDAIHISLATGTPPDLHSNALAYAFPYQTRHIVILYDRILAMADGDASVIDLLAYVLLHEITHVLQGIAMHSDAGIMKARWTRQDMLRMHDASLTFNQRDIELINAGYRARQRLHALPRENPGTHCEEEAN